ncbi:MAG: 3-isopropylmalate dehydratase large subunit [Candidatus Bathyarchaeia archaeon]
MGMTICEKILASHSGVNKVSPGEIVNATIDLAFVHEMLGMPGGAAELFKRAGIRRVWDPSRIVALLDHWTPPSTVDAAETHKVCREFVREHGIENWYDMKEGICHQILPEKGHVLPGELIVGSDSHTITSGAFGALAAGIGSTDMTIVFATGKLWFKVPETIKINIDGEIPPNIVGKDIALQILQKLGAEGANYKSIEFYGEAIKQTSVDSRMTITNMCAEVGAKDAIIPPDEKTMDYLSKRVSGDPKPVYASPDAEYSEELTLDVTDLEPQVALPPSPCNSVPVTQVEGEPIDVAFIGSCTNGRLEDMMIASNILEGRRVADSVRLIVIPASREVMINSLRMGYLETILEAGGIIEGATCGPCMGGHMGVLASGEVAISTANRNFIGRMGHHTSKIYLASPATVAASSVTGRITDPRKVW